MLALDTNVLARYYVHEGGSSRQQEEAARALIEAGAPHFVPKSVLLELEWVLRGVYGHPPADVLRVLTHLAALPHVAIEDAATVNQAFVDSTGATTTVKHWPHDARPRPEPARRRSCRRQAAARRGAAGRRST